MRCKMKVKKSYLLYFLSRSLFLGGGISTLFLYSSKDAYISIILGTLLGIIIVYIISYISNDINTNIHEYLKKNNFLNILIKISFILYILFLIFLLLTILATFLYSYFLVFTPSFISCLPFIFLATYLNSKSINKISSIAQVLIVISLILVFLKTVLLANNYDFNNLLPIFSIKSTNIFKTALIFSILSTVPYITLIDEKITFKESLKYYLISTFTIFIVVVVITIVLGQMVNIYSYPEYSVLRKISLFNFIENIENFISASWFFDIFISLSVCTFKLKQVINTKCQLIPFIISLIILYIVNEYIANNFYNAMVIYKSFPLILAIFLVLLLILFLIKKIYKNIDS